MIILFNLIWLLHCTNTTPPKQHIFYLHGRIVELQGANAEHPQFGKYLYHDIIDSLKTENTIVHHDLRPADVDFNAYAERIAQQIDSLIQMKVAPEYITVVGASKGAVLAMYISHLNPNPINYVLLAANNDYIERENDWRLHGRILGIYERSDSLAGKHYRHWIARSTEAVRFEEIEINTGLGHGFLYRPLGEWLELTRGWIEQ
ncbi:MAG: alpha/beta hydrolase [Saprospiraceae bacterium]